MRRTLFLMLFLAVGATWAALSVTCGWTRACAQEPSKSTIVELLPPSGKSPTGRTSYHWVDEARQEPNVDAPGQKRELTVHIWYPAQKGGEGKPAPYVPDILTFQTAFGAANLKREAGAAY